MTDDALAAAYEAALASGIRVPLVRWTTVRMTGADRASFLHNMCTNDIRSLAPGGQCEAFLTDVKGKIVGYVQVFATDDSLLLVTVPDQGSKLISHLDRYIIRENVQLSDASDGTAWSLAMGAKPDSWASAAELKFPCQVLWPGGFWLSAPTRQNDKRDGLVCAPAQHAAHALRLESGWPLYGVDFDESNLPQEVGRDAQAISFRKGCYLGQETVARIDALGHVNKRLALVRLDADDAAVDSELTAGEQVVGRLSSVAWSPQHQRLIGMAMIRRGSNALGTTLRCSGCGAEIIAPLPPRS